MPGPRVVLACPGLDHAHRGFETFARECFAALAGRPDLEMELVKGSGPRAPHERAIPTLTRDARLARAAGRLAGRDPFVVEHVAFTAALVPVLMARRPDVVYFSEWHVGRLLARWRRATGSSFGLVFCNGAFAGEGYGQFDRVQQLTPAALERAVAHGQPRELQVALPLGFAIPPALAPLEPGERAALRRRLGLPEDRRIILSAGAIRRSHKRMDVLVREIAAMPAPRPFLLLVGQQEADTPDIRRLAEQLLEPGSHDIRTVAPDAMPDVYRAADAFVLASLAERFGRVLTEAQAQGLPCLAHEHPVMSWVLGDEGDTADLASPGSIAAWLHDLPADALSEERRQRRHQSAYQRFSWAILADRYAELLCVVAQERRATDRL